MKNKEIEELLNTFKELINTYSPDTEPFTIDYDYEIKYSALESFLSYIEQLQTTANKCKQLENNIDKAIEYIEEHTDKIKKIVIPKIDFNYKKLLDILKGDNNGD